MTVAPSNEAPKKRAGCLRRLARVIGVLVLLAAVALLVAWLLGQRELGRVNEGWAAIGRPMEELERRHPELPTNPSAVELERLAAALGVDLVADEADDERSVEVAEVDVRGPLDAWLDSELARPEATISPPPHDVQQVLARHGSEIEALVRHLLSEAAPAWSFRMEPGAELGHLPGLLRLQEILLASALAAQQGGEPRLAEERLRAAWKLWSHERRRPALLVQLVSPAATRQRLAVLRRLPARRERWLPRLREVEPRAELLDAIQREARDWEVMADRPGLILHEMRSGSRPGRAKDAAILQVARPVLAFMASDTSDRYRRLAEAVQERAPCRGVKDVWTDVVRTTPRWSVVPRIALESFPAEDVLAGAERTSLQLELTRKVLLTRELLEAGTPTDAEIEEIESTACTTGSWKLEIDEGDAGGRGFRLSFAGTPPPARRAALPLEHVEVAAP